MRSVLAILFLAGCAAAHEDPLPGVKLGMAPRDVRERLAPGGEGSWQTKLAAPSDDTILEWKAKDPGVRVPDAQFEFHLGMLVAVRGHVAGDVPTGIEVTPKTVTSRVRSDSLTAVTTLARDCPTHHDEAEALAAKVSSR